MNTSFSFVRSLFVVLLAAPLFSACAVLKEFEDQVAVRAVTPAEYIARKRGDVLSGGVPSQATLETVKFAGLDAGPCASLDKPSPGCIDALTAAPGVDTERRLSALSELWLQQALALRSTPPGDGPAAPLDAWLETARHAYAYLFFTNRKPSARAFEERQTQVRDYYNLAAQEVAVILFARSRTRNTASQNDTVARVGAWTVRSDLSAVGGMAAAMPPEELVPASALAFSGLRSQYRRDGFGSELVAVLDAQARAPAAGPPRDGQAKDRGVPRRRKAWSDMPYQSVTVLLRFAGSTLAEVLGTHDASISVYDPYQQERVTLHDQEVPLAGDFTAGYGLWLARSGFARQSIRSLLGREQGIDRPHLYLMHPYDPKRRIIVMIHGLASSPEAWVNVANEITGDETLRRQYQIWQVYYPTNLPIAISHAQIRRAVGDTLRHFDPAGQARASKDMVVVGHSMGGLIARLMVSSSKDTPLSRLIAHSRFDERRRQRLQSRLASLIDFEPLPEVGRAVFIAAPHRGTPAARHRLSRLLAGLIRLPLSVLEELSDIVQGPDGGPGPVPRLPTGLDNLRDDDPFIRAAADLPVSPDVRYHSIIARTNAEGPLARSDDGLVPYGSAHLPGAVSEKVIVSGHSVQETAAAVLELRRILLEDTRERAAGD